MYSEHKLGIYSRVTAKYEIDDVAEKHGNTIPRSCCLIMLVSMAAWIFFLGFVSSS
jgi:hypothetical protein